MKYTWNIRQILQDNISPPVYASFSIKIPWMGQANQICFPPLFLKIYVLFQNKVVDSPVHGLKHRGILSVNPSTTVIPAQPLSVFPSLCSHSLLYPPFTSSFPPAIGHGNVAKRKHAAQVLTRGITA